MEIGWPSNVRHIAHVTFDKFSGFLGLPVELEPEVPKKPPSASATVFGVSTESMQLSYDSKGNSVPTILLLMQSRLYSEGGLQAEGIFRITAENSQEECVREQLNKGEVPEGIDVHCLSGLIKAWFRELPTGVLDSLKPEQVMQCKTEYDYVELAKHLPPIEAALLDWAVNLMADVVEQEHINKMSSRNIAMVFAPNMTKMADPLNALMYAVKVMNFLRMLILRALRDRGHSVEESGLEPSAESADQGGLEFYPQAQVTTEGNEDVEESYSVNETDEESNSDDDITNEHDESYLEKQNLNSDVPFETPCQLDNFRYARDAGNVSSLNNDLQVPLGKSSTGQSSNSKPDHSLGNILYGQVTIGHKTES